MSRINYILPGFVVWLLQLLASDLLAIDTVRPDFCVLFILYWSIKFGRTVGITHGFILGLLVDLSGTGTFFGLSSMTYSITGYLAGSLNNYRNRVNSFYFNIIWLIILLIQFFIYCSIQYQSLWELNFQLFLGKWFGTSIYTLSFCLILQFIFPISRIEHVKS